MHFFKLYNPMLDNDVEKNIDVFSRYNSRQLLLAPPQSNKSHITQNRNNPSTYLIDGGLWTACKESRLVMERNFNCHRRKPSSQGRKLSRYEIAETRRDMPETSYFACHDGNAHFFTVFSHKDLFILRPQNLETIHWSNSIRDIELGSYIRHFGRLRNIALEYNPEWGCRAEEKIVDMAMKVNEHHYGVNIWIVDYTLRRRDSAFVGKKPTSRRNKNMAFHLNGRRFIPVNVPQCHEQG
ncbi:2EXR domain-containing protein [Fusarium sp. LHS14.1]|nr:2EXR domain-containing protein [Fusarium sp. LHS14.1]